MTVCAHSGWAYSGISIHTLRVEGDGRPLRGTGRRRISIHTLRVEGDDQAFNLVVKGAQFQSTPSAWRVTVWDNPWNLVFTNISIHTLRVEGDPDDDKSYTTGDVFQSTPSAWRVTLPF